MLRAIREVSPRYVVGENVRGLTNWNGGVVFDEVQADLEAEGYEVLPFLLPAAGVGAPHRRDRVWFIAHRADARAESVRQRRGNAVYGPEPVAYPGGEQLQDRTPDGVRSHRAENGTRVDHRTKRHGNTWNASDAQGVGMEGSGANRQQVAPAHGGQGLSVCHSAGADWAEWPTVAPLCSRNDGIPAGLDLNAISFGKWRQESVKAAGNAIVPQVALQIFLAIAAYESLPSQKL
jgi:DNA (cytosine-5)-methyltransferase 1